MALNLLSSSDIHSSCRQRIEACELWLRMLIHDNLYATFGADYVNKAEINGNDVFNIKMKARIQDYCFADPHRYKRPVDTLVFDSLGIILGKEGIYNQLFREVFNTHFPCGARQIKHIISIIANHRNALYHANASTLSLHDAEQVLCYCSDIIFAIKEHYTKMSQNDKFPAPSFTKYLDSTGNIHYVNDPRSHLIFENTTLYMGDTVRFEVEVDSSYSPEEYDIIWRIKGAEIAAGPAFFLTLTTAHVGMKFGIQADLQSKNTWHRIDETNDAILTIEYEVLPLPRSA